MPTKTITREELYNRVWTETVDRLSKELGISNVGLGKLCRRHDIPVPPRGYWAKKEHGHKARQTPYLHYEMVTPIPSTLATSRRQRPPTLQPTFIH